MRALHRRMHPLISATRAAACCVLIVIATTSASRTSAATSSGEQHVFFGTYTKGKSKGIYRARFDTQTGKLDAPQLAAEANDPSFLAVHPNGRVLYAIDERSDPAKTPAKGVAAYAIERGTGRLTLLNEQSVGGPGPCHIVVDTTGNCVLVANYVGGSVAAIALESDGRLGKVGSVMQHHGSSVHARQKAPHAHAVALSPDNRFVLAADLGLDRVLAYKFDPTRATLTAHEPASATLPPGSGPRHLAFRPDGKFLYVINELVCTMTVFQYDAARAAMSAVQTISTLPPGESVQQGYSTAEVILHPNGRFLYGSNRGHNSIVVYAIEPSTGKLTLVEHESTQGKTPRHFAVDPSGRWLLAENQGSDSVVVFRIVGSSGILEPTGRTAEVPMPVCAVFVPVN